MLKKIILLSTFLFLQTAYGANNGFKIVEVKDNIFAKRLLLGGSVVPITEVNFSAQLSGDIISFIGQEGDYYTKGQTIVALEQDSILAQEEAAKAEIEALQEALKNASVQYNKSLISPYADSNNMFGGAPWMFNMFTSPMRNFVDRGDYDFEKYAIRSNYYSELAQTNKRLKKARSKLKEIESKLKDTKVVAPFDGVLIRKMVDLGDSVQRGDLLLSFANTEQLQVEVDVPARLLHSIKKNKQYRIRLDISNLVVLAKLVQIYPIASIDTHTVKVKFDLPQGVPTIAGSYAELELFDIISSKRTLIIPESALIWRSSIPSVFVLNKDGKTELRFVRIGDKVDTDNISILSGLTIGEKVVVSPSALMTSGMSL